jgi:uncharacterized protein DUF6457
MDAWLETAADTLSRETGVPRENLDLDGREIEALLGAAGRAAHESGARTNAPLLCYLIGKAAAEGGLTAIEVAAMFERTVAATASETG